MRNATRNSGRLLNDQPRLTVQEKRRRLLQRDKWLEAISPDSHFGLLFDELPDVHFFAKDRRGRLMFLDRGALDRYEMEPAEVVGATDFELNPRFFAVGNSDDDDRVLNRGEAIRRKKELWFDHRGVPDWYEVTKLPVRSKRGKIIGIMGILKPYRGDTGSDSPWGEITQMLEYIHVHFAEDLTVARLAKMVDLSTRQLERRFHMLIGMSPKQYIIRTRIGAVCRALRGGNDSLAHIAADCGFCDQSSLTQHFHHCVGMTPTQFRRAHFARDEK